MKHYRVRLTEKDEQDMVDVYRYIVRHDSLEKAAYVLDQLESFCARLTELPDRGHVRPELQRVRVMNYREVRLKLYVPSMKLSGRTCSFTVCGIGDGICSLYSSPRAPLMFGKSKDTPSLPTFGTNNVRIKSLALAWTGAPP